MSNPGRLNTLAAYVAAGGEAWLAGGGGAYAVCRDLGNSVTNDTYAFVYSNQIGTELQPGRFMYDLAHWQSELSVWTVPAYSAMPRRSAATGLRGLDYSRLPEVLTARAPETDPVPPQRTPPMFYPNGASASFEYLAKPNSILENISTSPGHGLLVSALDTLYTIRVPGVPPHAAGPALHDRLPRTRLPTLRVHRFRPLDLEPARVPEPGRDRAHRPLALVSRDSGLRR
jgi:hypothetical protein